MALLKNNHQEKDLCPKDNTTLRVGTDLTDDGRRVLDSEGGLGDEGVLSSSAPLPDSTYRVIRSVLEYY